MNNYNNFNPKTNINGGDRVNARGDRAGGKQSWQHNAANRKGVNYRDGATAQKYGGSGSSTRVSSAEARGRGGTGATADAAGRRRDPRRRGGEPAGGRGCIVPLRRIERARLAMRRRVGSSGGGIVPLRRIAARPLERIGRVRRGPCGRRGRLARRSCRLAGVGERGVARRRGIAARRERREP